MKRTSKALVVAGLVALAGAIPATLALAGSASLAGCTRSQLGVRSNGTQGALGTIYGAWDLTNVSTTSCTLDGYPDIDLYGRRGRPIPLAVHDSLTPGPSQVTLSPGSSATFRTSYSDVPSGREACRVSSVIQVTAPDTNASLFVPAQLGPCRGILNVSAVEQGVQPA